MKYIKFVVITFCLMACQQCLKESDFEIMTIEKSHNDEVGISDTTIVAPIGYFIIIKKNDKYCALKIHEYGKHRTKYYDSYVKYDYYQSDSSGNFLKKIQKMAMASHQDVCCQFMVDYLSIFVMRICCVVIFI